MIIKIDNARICYDEIIKKIRKKNGRLLIFVSFDVDSICSIRLLKNLLRIDSIKFEIIPVMNYDILDKNLEEYRKINDEKKDISSIIMLNCGGTIDLSNYWFTDRIFDILCLVIDSHRPINHNNIHSNSIVFIDDSKYSLEDVPKEEDLKEVKEADSDEDDYDENDNFEDDEKSANNEKLNLKQEDNENLYEDEENKEKNISENVMDIGDEEEEKNKNKKKKKLIKKKEHLEDINESNEDNESRLDDIDLSDKKQKKNAEIDEKNLKRKIKKKKKMKIANYYAGKYYGFPSAFIIYNIITQVNRDDNQSLWLLIVATTDHYLQSHFSEDVYDQIRSFCLKDVLRLNKNNTNKLVNLQNLDEDDDNKDKFVKTIQKEVKTITQESDYKLFLYKHWNLFDSFVYSTYTVASLVTWKEEGKREIQKILAYMGIPLDEAKQKYSYMKNEYKTIFKDKIIEISKKFDMRDLVFESFTYQFDQRIQLSACDFVYCLNAILEYPFNMNDSQEEFICVSSEFIDEIDEKNIQENEETGEDSQDENTGGIDLNKNKPLKIDHFWTTYEFLGLKNSKLVKLAFDLAIKFQISLVNNGTAVLDKRKINPSSNFRYAIINNDLSDDIKYFQNPLSLEKLSLFVMNIYHKSKIVKSMEIKPFILALLNSVNKSYLVAGVLCNEGSTNKNDFSMRFRISARNLSAKLVYNNFNDCIVEISKNDFLAFLEDVCNS